MRGLFHEKQFAGQQKCVGSKWCSGGSDVRKLGKEEKMDILDWMIVIICSVQDLNLKG
jgi:hypothetical protein